MSPVVARAALRAAGRRDFSLMTSLRHLARGLEPKVGVHHNPIVNTKAQAGDWGKQARRISTQAVIYFPGMALIFGWPALAKMYFNGRV